MTVRLRLSFICLAIAAAFAFVALSPPPAAAQPVPGIAKPKDEAKPADEKPTDPAGRETPKSMVGNLLNALADRDFERAADYLNYQDIPSWRRPASGPALASMLLKLLDQAGYLDAGFILSDQPAGRQDNGQPANVNRIGGVRTINGNVDLLAQRISGREPMPIWLVSAETLGRLPELLRTAVSGPLDKILPANLIQNHFWGAPIGHWLALAVLAVGGYAVAWITSLGIRWLAGRIAPPHGPVADIVAAADKPLRILLGVALFLLCGFLLGVSIIARQRTGPIALVCVWVALIWLVWRMTDIGAAAVSGRAATRGHFAALSVVSMLRRTLKFALIGLGFILALDAVGVNVTAGLAALGIGGLAIALGAQKTIENFISSLTIIADQPIRVGDFCKFGNVVGTIEDIGIRSSRIRTLERTIVTIPNSQMASTMIENYASRDRFWFHPTIGVRYETTPDQIRFLLVRIREMLYAHPKVSPDPARVRFTGFGASSLSLEIFAYVLGKDYDEFLEVQEDLSLRIMDIVQAAGCAFAFPSQTLYFSRDGRPDEGAVHAAEEQVREWAGAGELPIPAFPPERIAALRGAIKYPVNEAQRRAS